MKIYQVGGAVRDRLLKLPVKDRDWVVVGATEDEMLEAGFTRVNAEFPVFLHPVTGEEYALARREMKTGPGYKGFTVEAGPDVTLEEDLIRRDLTINALVEDEAGRLIDLYGGCDDLDNGKLRHISPAFIEDPVRLLRVARFAAKLGRWGFHVAHATHSLMQQMSASEELKALRPERVWREMRQALQEEEPWHFYEVLHACGALHRLIPEIDSLMATNKGHEQRSESQLMQALKRVSMRTRDPLVRFAVVIYPAARIMLDPQPLCERLRAEREYVELSQLLLRMDSTYKAALGGDPEKILELIEAARAMQQPVRFRRFCTACAVLWPENHKHFDFQLERILKAVAAVLPTELLQQGLRGAELGRELHRRRLDAICQLQKQSA